MTHQQLPLPVDMVSIVCPICTRTIKNKPDWEQRVEVPSSEPRVRQYVHKDCYDRAMEDIEQHYLDGK